jgi:hypothetical protein
MNRRKNAQERELLDPITRMMRQHIEDSLNCPGNRTQQNCRSFAILSRVFFPSESTDSKRSQTSGYLCSSQQFEHILDLLFLTYTAESLKSMIHL